MDDNGGSQPSGLVTRMRSDEERRTELVTRVSGQPGVLRRTDLRAGDVVRLVLVWIVSSAALAVADIVLDGLTAQAWWNYLVAAAIAGVLGLVFRPGLARLA